jgi:hypothetical protein
MKKQMLLILFVVLTINVFGQSYKRDLPETKEYFLEKSKKQKTAAWIMLGGGTLLCASGYVFFIYEGLQGDGIYSTKAKLSLLMFYGGGGAMVGSIPLFIAAARNKGISMSATASLKIENNISLVQPNFVKASYPALSLKINLK